MNKGVGFFIKRYIQYPIESLINTKRVKDKQKIFCVGRNKTGTTSLTYEFKDRNFIVGNEYIAQLTLRKPYYNKNFQPIIKHCKTAQVFQDVPFSWVGTYKHVDKAYPDSKFILSIRDAESWYKSVVNHMSNHITNGERVPTIKDFKNFKNGFYYKDFLAKKYRGTVEDPLDKDFLINEYNKHNQEIIEYFKGTGRLLVVDVSNTDDYSKFCKFLNLEQVNDSFPWKNKVKKKLV